MVVAKNHLVGSEVVLGQPPPALEDLRLRKAIGGLGLDQTFVEGVFFCPDEKNLSTRSRSSSSTGQTRARTMLLFRAGGRVSFLNCGNKVGDWTSILQYIH